MQYAQHLKSKFFAGLISLLLSQSSFAGLISHQVDFTTAFSRHTNTSTDEDAKFRKGLFNNKLEHIYLPQFDSSLGTLTDVTFDFTGSYFYTLFLTVSDYDEVGVNGQGYYYKAQGNSSIYSSLAPVINGTYLSEYNGPRVTSFNQSAHTSCLDGKWDGDNDFLQCQKGSRSLNGISFSDTFDWYKPSFAPFLGDDTFTLDMNYFNSHMVYLEDGTSAVSELDMKWQGSVSVKYNFVEVSEVPEPSSIAIFSLALVGLVVRKRNISIPRALEKNY